MVSATMRRQAPPAEGFLRVGEIRTPELDFAYAQARRSVDRSGSPAIRGRS